MVRDSQLLVSNQLEARIRGQIDSDGEPFYLYDSWRIRENCRKLLDIGYAPKSIHFAMMANSNPKIVQIIKDSGLNIFVNSIVHLESAVQLGFDGNQIIFAASAMDDHTMHKAALYGARVILDSRGQLDRWKRFFPNVGVGIRCNIGGLVAPKNTSAGYFIGEESRLGMTIDEIDDLAGDPCVIGLHIYVGTNLVDLDYFLNCYRKVAVLAKMFPALRFLDFGGGFGLPGDTGEDLDWVTYRQRVSALMHELSNNLGRPVELILEPGRIIGGDAGYFICSVTDVKYRKERQLVGVNASSAQFPRPLFYPESTFHPASILAQDRTSSGNLQLLSSIFGCSTYSRDYLAREVLLPEVHAGDIVILGYAGSYCASSYTTFLGFPPAPEYFL